MVIFHSIQGKRAKCPNDPGERPLPSAHRRKHRNSPEIPTHSAIGTPGRQRTRRFGAFTVPSVSSNAGDADSRA